MKLKIKSFLFYALLASFFSFAQKKPKLIVGVVVDQMRYDYLIRFYNKFGNEGFKKLMMQGNHLENLYYNYIPTYTAVGHASIYTGTTGENHGIISNSWYDKYQKKYIYCVDDQRYNTIGGKNGGKKSPHRMQTTGIMDQLHLAQNGKGKTIGISIKDRSAILPAGHTANAAYWFEGDKEGNFISSSFYMKKLPEWVEKFNQKKIVKSYINQSWNTLYPIKTYTESRSDDTPYEGVFDGEEKPVFPHNLKILKDKNGYYSIVKNTPFGNDLLLDFTKATITGENLGQSNHTDFLSISFSSTDYIGHMYGPYSKEIEDTYIRLDKNIADLITFLDKKVGKNNYTLFLTADHGVVPVPSYLKNLKIPAGYFNKKAFKKFVKKITFEKFGSDDLIENISNFQIYLNKEIIKSRNLKAREIQDFLVAEIIHFDKVYKAIGAYHLQNNNFNNGLLSSLQRGYNQKFSGDVLFILLPDILAGDKQTGTSHGTAYSYDTHVPLLFYGYGIKKGITKKTYYITDITPTIANLLQITPPNGSTGKIILEALK